MQCVVAHGCMHVEPEPEADGPDRTQVGASPKRGGPSRASGRQRPGDRFVVMSTILAGIPGVQERAHAGTAKVSWRQPRVPV